MKGDQGKQLWLLRRYLKQCSVPSELSKRIFKFLEHRSKVSASQVSESQIPIIEKLSVALRHDLTYSIISGLLKLHKFFSVLDTEMNRAMHQICSILEGKTYSESEVIFNGGTRADQTFFKRSGELRYISLDGLLLQPPPLEGECVAEATLWLEEWRHQGELTACEVSDLFSMDPVQFANIMRLHPKTWFFAGSYAWQFLHYIQNAEPEGYIDFVRHFPGSAIDQILIGSEHFDPVPE